MRKISRKGAVSGVAVGALASFVAWANWPATPLAEGTKVDHVIVHKAARVVELYSGTELVRSYPVSLGRHPVGAKAQQGDGKTPEGQYRLDFVKLDSGFHRALHISYPDAKDMASARARGVDAGGAVMVHGMKNRLGWIGRMHRLIDWTDGCVAVTDQEIEEIVRVVPVGSVIRIEP